MGRFFGAGCALLVGLMAVAASSPAEAQMSSNPAEITACLCQQQEIATL